MPLSEARSYWLHNLTPLHVGTGRGLGFIDLPIAREKVTNFPIVPGSAFKGVISDYFDPEGDLRSERSQNKAEQKLFCQAFGKGGEEASNAGSLVFTDARILCMPVRSLYGTFAWCTSPVVLGRLARDLESIQGTPPRIDIPALPDGGAEASLPAFVPAGTPSVLHEQRKVYLDDLDLSVQDDADTTAWAELIAGHVFSDDTWKSLFVERFLVVSNDAFSFLTEMATQIDARVRIDHDSKTVAGGALWYEESLPAETILSGIVWCGPIFDPNPSENASRFDAQRRNQILQKYVTDPQTLQIGGKASVGRGQVRVCFA